MYIYSWSRIACFYSFHCRIHCFYDEESNNEYNVNEKFDRPIKDRCQRDALYTQFISTLPHRYQRVETRATTGTGTAHYRRYSFHS